MSDPSSNPLNLLGNASDPAGGPDDVEVVGIDALRERAASGLETALGFVEEHGNAFARMRARVLVELEPLERGVELLASFQQPDGSFPGIGEVLMDPASSQVRRWDKQEEILGTLEALSVLSDWDHLFEPCGDRAIEYLGQSQTPEGYWGGSAGTPDDSAVCVFVTGSIAGFLGRSRTVRPEILKAAGSYLGALWSVDFIRRHGWPATSGFAHYFTNVFDDEGEAALPWCARELDRGRRVGDYSAVQVLRVLFHCQASALPGVDFDTNSLLDQVLRDQLEDGSVGSPELPREHRVASTLDAMLFMLRLCRSGGQESV
jgi:hypothetical protein